MDSCIKLLSGRYHTVQIACLNALFALLPLLAAAAWGGGLHRLAAPTPAAAGAARPLPGVRRAAHLLPRTA